MAYDTVAFVSTAGDGREADPTASQLLDRRLKVVHLDIGYATVPNFRVKSIPVVQRETGLPFRKGQLQQLAVTFLLHNPWPKLLGLPPYPAGPVDNQHDTRFNLA